MEQSFWQSKWDKGQIGFHRDSVNPNLVKHWEALDAWLEPETEPGRVLVPLCGKTLDLHWLEERGNQVVGVEFVEAAAQRYFEERGATPVLERRGGFPCYSYGNTEIVVGDFFKLTEQVVGPVDRVYDRAALVAIAPETRSDYVAKLQQLMQPGAGVLLITFEHDMPSGPPFSIPQIDDLYESGWRVNKAQQHDLLKLEPEFRQRGASTLEEIVWFLQWTG